MMHAGSCSEGSAECYGKHSFTWRAIHGPRCVNRVALIGQARTQAMLSLVPQ